MEIGLGIMAFGGLWGFIIDSEDFIFRSILLGLTVFFLGAFFGVR